jgi:4-hydroxybenzoate polyprenyltransferase
MSGLMTLKKRLDAYERLMRLDKPIGILLLLWPTLWALWLAAPGHMRLDLPIIFLVGTVLMRSAGCVINDLADRRLDPHVQRTRDRPLAAGEVSSGEALALALALLAVALVLVLRLHRLALYLSFFGVAITVVYPFLKRFFSFPQAGLGIAFSFGIPMAFAAQLGELPSLTWILMAATFFWIIAYDTEYAMVDRDDDMRIGVHSSAILFGRHDVLAVLLCQGVFLAIMIFIGGWLRLGLLYYVGLGFAVLFAALQFWLIRDRDREKCFQAFLSNGWMGGAIFAGLALDMVVRVPISLH